MCHKLQHLSLEFYSGRETSEILSRFSNDLHAIDLALVAAIGWGLQPVFDIVLSVALVFAFEWRLALIGTLLCPICALAALEYSNLHFEETTHYLDRSPNFQTTLGFIPRVNIRQVDLDLADHFLPTGDLIKAWGPTMELIEDWDHTEKIQDRIITPGMAFELTGQTFITAQHIESTEVYQNISFRKHLTDFSVNTDRGVNYFPAAGAVLGNIGSAQRMQYIPRSAIQSTSRRGCSQFRFRLLRTFGRGRTEGEAAENECVRS